MTVAQVITRLDNSETPDQILAAGADMNTLIAALRARAQTVNITAQAALTYPTDLGSSDWAARKAWMLDGQMFYGEISAFYLEALAELNADDQEGYAQNMDVLFKALRTFIPDPA
jgi:hypothetical protein